MNEVESRLPRIDLAIADVERPDAADASANLSQQQEDDVIRLAYS